MLIYTINLFIIYINCVIVLHVCVLRFGYAFAWFIGRVLSDTSMTMDYYHCILYNSSSMFQGDERSSVNPQQPFNIPYLYVVKFITTVSSNKIWVQIKPVFNLVKTLGTLEYVLCNRDLLPKLGWALGIIHDYSQ